MVNKNRRAEGEEYVTNIGEDSLHINIGSHLSAALKRIEYVTAAESQRLLGGCT